MSNSEHWYAYGTFKVCPELFFQAYTAHAQQGRRIFRCVFGLLLNKMEGTYTRLWRVHIQDYGGYIYKIFRELFESHKGELLGMFDFEKVQ